MLKNQIISICVTDSSLFEDLNFMYPLLCIPLKGFLSEDFEANASEFFLEVLPHYWLCIIDRFMLKFNNFQER